MSSTVKNPTSPTIPLDQNGAWHGFLKLPYSRNDSAWGSVMVPISVIRNGDGPTALFTGANHGDEYEGPIALQELATSLKPEEISGRVIIVPFLNHPAFLAGTRTSPIDGANMNRIFPGQPNGSVSQKIADYVATTLLPLADLVLDFHSGGKTLDFLPFAACHILEDKKQEKACFAAMQAFNAPWSMTMLEIDNVGMLDTEAEGQGKVFVTTELGGGGTSTARSVAIAKKGARNLLCHLGILDEKPVIEPTINLDMPDGDCFSFAEASGLVEFRVDMGEEVGKGDVVALIWPVERTGEAPKQVTAKRAGILAARHFPGLVKMGDCVAVIGVVVEPV